MMMMMMMLSLAAAWSRCDFSEYDSPGCGKWYASAEFLAMRRAVFETSADQLQSSARTIRGGCLGVLADALRTKFCGGDDCVLRRTENERALSFFFAATFPSVRGATISDYRSWVEKLSRTEFADELVVAAVARELDLKIAVVPFTPAEARGEWAIATFGRADLPRGRTVHFGNNDVHYVWIKTSED